MKHSQVRHLLAAALFEAILGLNASSVAGAAEPPAVELAGQERLIYDSAKGGCGPEDISDAPMRAVRLQSGGVLAGASWATNRLFHGNDLSSLSKDCHSAYTSANKRDPAAFDDWSWLMSFWTDDGRKIYALAHHEYQAQRFPGKCEFQKQTQCSYDAITAFKSDDEGKSFRRAGYEPVAAPRRIQSPSTGRTVGVLHPSNIVQSGDFHYFIAQVKGDDEQRAGECLFRSRNLAEPSHWEYLTATGWTESSFSAYSKKAPPGPCKPLSHLSGIVWSLLKYDKSGAFLALLTVASDQPNRVELAISASSDLMTWSPLKPFYRIAAAWNNDCQIQNRYNYPSLLDPLSSSRNFETISSSGTLFMTRIKTAKCAPTMQRDVVAIPVKLD